MAHSDPAAGTVRASLLDELERLDARPGLDGDDLARLIFLFRASDPGVYQPAALLLGQRAAREEPADRALFDYARERGIDGDRPLALDGRRSTRRVLLARTGAWIHAGDGLRGPPPVTPQQVAAGRPTEPADAAVLLDTVTRLLATEGVEGLAEAAGRLLDDLPDHRAGRMVWRRWTELLFALRRHGIPMQVPACTGAWTDALDRLVTGADAGARPVAEGAQRLVAIDELCRVAGDHPQAIQELATAWPASLLESDRRWCRLRLATWCRRQRPEAEPPVTVEPREYTGLGHDAAALEQARRERPGHIGPSAVEEREQALLAALADRLAAPDAWHRRPARERALALFLITDLDAAIALSPRRVLALPGVTIGSSGLTVPWLLRATGWEGIPPEALLDARTLHGIHDSALQEQLVLPDGTSTGALADVLEHRFREQLRHSPDWDPRRFLLRLHARRPGSRLLRGMASVARDRTYTAAGGDAGDIPLARWCRALADEGGDGEAPGLDSTEGHRACVLRELHALAADPGPPADALRRMVSLVGHAGGTVGAPPGTVVGLLRYLGPPAGTHALPEGALDTIHRDLLALPALLEPDGWRSLHHAREAAAGLDQHLAALTACLTPLLPAAEGTALQTASRSMRHAARAWLQGLDAVAAASARNGDAPADWAAALERIPAHLPPSLQGPLLVEVWSGLHATTDQPTALLRWAVGRLDPGVAQPVVTALATRWCERVQHAMDAGEAEDVRRLVGDPAFAPLRERAADPELGRRLRRWHFDRLRPLLGIDACRRLGGPTGTLGGLAGFLGHFAAVWIGLLVGTILMLDFGDAWRTMAEAGDVRGIAATFFLGTGGTGAYLLAHLRSRIRRSPAQTPAGFWFGQLGRVAGFLLVCLAYTLAATSGLWLLLADTGEVVQGTLALGHIVVWAGFALFAGTFFGLVAKEI